MTGVIRARKKPVVIEAMHLPEAYPDGVDPSSDGYALNLAAAAIMDWLNASGVKGVPPAALEAGQWSIDPSDGALLIGTLEGTMKATPGDWIIRGVQGEFYPCKPDIFAATYDIVEEGMRLLAKRDESIDRLIETLDEETAKRIVGYSAGWCVPSDGAYDILPPSEGVEMLPEFPAPTARRGGIVWGAAPKREPEVLPAPPEGAGPGSWHFAVRDEDGDIYSTYGTWDTTPFSSPSEAMEVWGHLDGATLLRRWVPRITLADWEEA